MYTSARSTLTSARSSAVAAAAAIALILIAFAVALPAAAATTAPAHQHAVGQPPAARAREAPDGAGAATARTPAARIAPSKRPAPALPVAHAPAAPGRGAGASAVPTPAAAPGAATPVHSRLPGPRLTHHSAGGQATATTAPAGAPAQATATAPGEAQPHSGASEGSPRAVAPAVTGSTRPRIRHDKPKASKHQLKTPEVPAAAASGESQGGAAGGAGVLGAGESTAGAAAAVASPAAPATATAPQTSSSEPGGGTAGAPVLVASALQQGSGSKPSTPPHTRGAPRRGRTRSAASVPAPARALTALPAATAVRAARAPALAVTPRSPSRHASAHTESPLVRTVTRIIGVVPLAIRLLLAGLIALTLALGALSRLSGARAHRLERQRGELLEDVGLLQAALLPAPPARIGPVGTSANYRPASGPAAGGDFYDLFALQDGRVAVIVGDVSGHGRGALSHTALLRFTLRAYLEAELSPRLALQSAAPVLERQLGGSMATVVLGVYHPRERTLTYACAGHPPPLLAGSQQVAPVTVCSAPPIGAGLPTGTRQTTVSIPGGALACFYTDGLVEARVAGELFGYTRLSRILAELPPEALAGELLDRVAAEADRRPDDMAACLLRIEGGSQPPVVSVEEIELDRAELQRDRLERFLLASGMGPIEAEEVTRSAGASVARNGRVLLELHLRQGPPEVHIQPQNLSILDPSLRSSVGAGGI